jgi:hypothetical protein
LSSNASAIKKNFFCLFHSHFEEQETKAERDYIIICLVSQYVVKPGSQFSLVISNLFSLEAGWYENAYCPG